MASTTHTIETEILDLERRYWQAMREQDVRTAVSLTDFPCLIAGARGVRSVDQASYEKMMNDSSMRIQEFEIEDEPAVRQLTDDVAGGGVRSAREDDRGGEADLAACVRQQRLGPARRRVAVRDAFRVGREQMKEVKDRAAATQV